MLSILPKGFGFLDEAKKSEVLLSITCKDFFSEFVHLDLIQTPYIRYGLQYQFGCLIPQQIFYFSGGESNSRNVQRAARSRLINGVVTTGTGRAEKREEPENREWLGEVE